MTGKVIFKPLPIPPPRLARAIRADLERMEFVDIDIDDNVVLLPNGDLISSQEARLWQELEQAELREWAAWEEACRR